MCKCRILGGETYALVDEIGLTKRERAAGWILSCVRYAKSDIELEVQYLEHQEIFKPRVIPCKISKIERPTTDVMQVFLRMPLDAHFAPVAGQYINMLLPGGEFRSYSVANSMNKSPLVELHIKKIEKGIMSNYWFNEAIINDFHRFEGPFGTFVIGDLRRKNLVFLVTGTGIAPVKAILEQLNDRPKTEHPDSVTLYWGNRNVSDFYLDFGAFNFPFTFKRVVSRASPKWSGEVGYVQNIFLSNDIDLARCIVYACGLDNMIRDARDLLLKSGLAVDCFYYDPFLPSGVL